MLIDFEHFGLWQAGVDEEGVGANVAVFEIAREIDDAAGIAIAPFDLNFLAVN